VQDHTLAHSKDVYTFFTVVLTIIDFFDREWIAQCVAALREGDAVAAPILSRLGGVPLKRVIRSLGTGYQYGFQEAKPENSPLAAAEMLSPICQQRSRPELSGGISPPFPSLST
jgi:hypothetical protein